MHHPFSCYPSGQLIFYGWVGRDRPLRHQHRVGSCVGSPTLADADFLSAFLTLSQRSHRFDPFRDQSNLKWLGRQGSNLRMPESKSGALPLGDAPLNKMDFLAKLGHVVKQKTDLATISVARSVSIE